MEDNIVITFTVADNYNSFIILQAIMRALECDVSVEPRDDLLDVVISCSDTVATTIEAMFQNIAI